MQYHTCHLVHDTDPGLDADGEDTMGTCELSELGEGYDPWGDGGDDGESWRQRRHGTAVEQGFRCEGGSTRGLRVGCDQDQLQLPG